MNLQNFATSVIEAMGGLVEPIEYALCEAIIPEEYKEHFQGKTELLLAFDFEVAEENPSAEFVTFGSYVLDKLIEIINTKAVTTVRYVVVDKLILAGAEEKLKKFLNIDRGTLKIIEEKKVMTGFVVFNFITGFTTEERVEENKEIWVNMAANTVSQEMKENKSSIFYETESQEVYPVNKVISVIDAFTIAFEEVKQFVDSEKLKYKDDLILQNEIKRIEEYYEELLKENNKKMQRKGATEEKIQELKGKSNTLLLEMERQLKEITEKYSVVTDIALQNGIIYFVPVIQYRIILESAHKEQEMVVFYNFITKSFTAE